MSKYQKKGRTQCWPWQGSEDTAPNRDAKMACDNNMCCNPRHVVDGGDELPGNSDLTPRVGDDENIEETIESLRETFVERNMNYDKRWGIKKLKQVLNGDTDEG